LLHLVGLSVLLYLIDDARSNKIKCRSCFDVNFNIILKQLCCASVSQ